MRYVRYILCIILISVIMHLFYSKSLGYVYSGMRWPGSSPTVYYKVSEWVPGYWHLESIDPADNTWNKAKAKFEFRHTGWTHKRWNNSPGENIIDYDYYDPWGDDVLASTQCWVITGTTNVSECNMVFNKDYHGYFGMDGEPNKYDIESIALHEFGHWLILGHSQNSSAVMYAQIGLGQLKRQLHQDDIDGIRHIYGFDDGGGCGSSGSGGGGNGGDEQMQKFSELKNNLHAQLLYSDNISYKDIEKLDSFFENNTNFQEIKKIINNNRDIHSRINAFSYIYGKKFFDLSSSHYQKLTDDEIKSMSAILESISSYGSDELREFLSNVENILANSENSLIGDVLVRIMNAATETLPSEYRISNFPNPFNNRTVLQYSLPRDSYVRISIYDITGRLVAKLVDEKMEAGVHQVEFIADNLSSGTYVYNLQADDHSIVQTMVLLK